MDRKKKSKKTQFSNWIGIIFLSALFYFTAGYFLSVANLDWRLMIIGFLSFFLGLGYDAWILKNHIKKQEDLEERIVLQEKNTESITEILQLMRDILKKMNR